MWWQNKTARKFFRVSAVVFICLLKNILNLKIVGPNQGSWH
jgi:hypothetical protein